MLSACPVAADKTVCFRRFVVPLIPKGNLFMPQDDSQPKPSLRRRVCHRVNRQKSAETGGGGDRNRQWGGIFITGAEAMESRALCE
jgi:hypothetical protein